MTKEQKQYLKNIRANQVKGICPQCKKIYWVFPEHLEVGKCSKCNISIVKHI